MWGGGDIQTLLAGNNFMHSQAVGMQKLWNFLFLPGPMNCYFQIGDEGGGGELPSTTPLIPM